MNITLHMMRKSTAKLQFVLDMMELLTDTGQQLRYEQPVYHAGPCRAHLFQSLYLELYLGLPL